MDDNNTCGVTLMDAERGVLRVEVDIPEGIRGDDALREAFCDGAAEAVASMANVLWPVG